MGLPRSGFDAGCLSDSGGAGGHQTIGLGHGVRQLGVIDHGRHLVLPQVHIAARKLFKIGRIGHGGYYKQTPAL